MTITFDLSRHHVAVFGAAGSLGEAVADAYLAAGARVSQLDVAPRADITACDATDPAAVQRTLQAAASLGGPITDLVHAAGVLTTVAPLAATDIGDARRMLEANLFSCTVVGQAGARMLPDGATMTFISSHAALHGAAGWAVYSATKAGVNRLVESLAKELGGRGIRTNAISPGSVDTPMMQTVISHKAATEGLTEAEVKRRYAAAIPLGRFATTDEIAEVCLFLSTPAAAYISGAVININGGEAPG